MEHQVDSSPEVIRSRIASRFHRPLAWVVLFVAALQPAVAEAATLPPVVGPHERISAADRASEIGYFGTCPESPDGRTIAYVLYDGRPVAGGSKFSSGGLYLCDIDRKHHVKIRDIENIRWEDGAGVIWLDNDTLGYLAYEQDLPVTYIVDRSGRVLKGPIEAYIGHGDAPDGCIAMSVDKRQYPKGSSLGSNGVYLYKAGEITKILDPERDLGALKDRLDGSDDPREWTFFHAQLSPHGTLLSIRLDTELGKQHLVTSQVDGTDVRLFGGPRKPLHQQWFDDETIFGHEFVSKPADGGPRFRAKLWDRDGNILRVLAGVGNHPGISPDRKFIATDNQYELEPVIITLYRVGSTEPLAILMRESPGPVWKMRTHVNPAFSRDGRYVYFNKPVGGVPQAHRVFVGDLVRSAD